MEQAGQEQRHISAAYKERLEQELQKRPKLQAWLNINQVYIERMRQEIQELKRLNEAEIERIKQEVQELQRINALSKEHLEQQRRCREHQLQDMREKSDVHQKLMEQDRSPMGETGGY